MTRELHHTPNIIIVIPTYWTWDGGRQNGPVETVYDHPTPLDGQSTLSRLLQSLACLPDDDFAVLVLTAVTHPELEQAAAERVARLVAPFRVHYPIAQATEADAAFIRHRCPGITGHVQMRGYAGVRNLQLLLSHALGAEVIVALDDEVVSPNYLRTALRFVGREHEGARVLGLAGFYLDAEEHVLLPERSPTGNVFLDKSAVMNAGARALQATPGRLVPTPVAFGGNMVFHRDLFTRVGFDPGITRGEDVDYLINARLAGHRFWLDKELCVTHMPPEAYDTHPYAKLAQDVYRFIYEREKLEATGLDPAQFDPYPGRFLRDDIATCALAALETLAEPEAVARFGSPRAIVADAERGAQKTAPRYLEFAAAWSDLVETIGQDTKICQRLKARFDRAGEKNEP